MRLRRRKKNEPSYPVITGRPGELIHLDMGPNEEPRLMYVAKRERGQTFEIVLREPISEDEFYARP